MELSIFLAKWLGLYFIIVSFLALIRKPHFMHVMDKMIHNEGLMALSGGIALLFGLFILIAHPVWEPNWRLIITLLGLIAVIQGIVRLAFTEKLQNYLSAEKFEKGYWLIFGIFFVLGIILTYCGFSRPS